MMNRGIRAKELKGYKRAKLSILRQLGFHVDKSVFDGATNEIQIDNIARSIITK